MTLVRQCIQGTLAPYVPDQDQPWNAQRIRHLYNRISFGATTAEVSAGLQMTPSDLIDQLLTQAESQPLPSIANYPWAESDEYGPDDNVYAQYQFLNQQWIEGMLTEGVRSKLVLFWSNHFVTEAQVYGRHSTYLFQYHYVLHKNALGNFKEFVKDIGRTPAMLRYLNSDVNTRQRPNENYGRELLELFTMGDGNYSQNDIEEISRALTGWKASYYDRTLRKTIYVPTKYNEFRFVKNDHDYDEKTIFGVTYTPADDDDGNNDYDKVHDIIFDQRKVETARFICSKIYRYYVYEIVDENILQEMVDIFIQSQFSIKAVLSALFKSEHFFNEEATGVRIKSHVEWYVIFMRQLGMEINKDYFFWDYRIDAKHPNNPSGRYLIRQIFNYGRIQGQELSDPVNVAGWPDYRTWINETSLVNRWNYMRTLINNDLRYDVTKERYRQICKDVSGNSNDPEQVTRDLIDQFMIAGLPEEEIQLAIIVFKEPVPSNYFDDGSWNLEFDEVPMQFQCLINYLITLPEFQLA